MHPFLSTIVEEIQVDQLIDLKDHCYVFPTRRASVYFKKYLTEKFGQEQYVWSPHLFSIVEFTEQWSDQVLLDPITLNLELYQIYQKYEPQARFDLFYAWGQVILRDMDEIDKYLVDAKQLFANLKGQRDLEEQFALPPEQLAFLRQFWNVLEKEPNTEVEQEFIKIWEILSDLYRDFKQALSAKDAAYEGMAQRAIVERLESGELVLPYKKIVFAGFNALSNAEERLVEHLTTHYDSLIYWDVDPYYLKDKKQEAGKFLRRYKERWGEHTAHRWVTNNTLETGVKNIHSVGVPMRVGQAKYIGETIEQLIGENKLDQTTSAIVLGDEGMLFPVLYALPESVPTINITMGYPLKDSPLYQLLETIVQLQKTRQQKETKKEGDGSTKALFYSKYVIALLNNPFIKSTAPEAIDKLSADLIRNNRVYIYGDTVLEKLDVKKGDKNKKEQVSIFERIFTGMDIFLDLSDCFNEVLLEVYRQVELENRSTTELDSPPDLQNRKLNEETEDELTLTPLMELEFVYHMLKQLRRIHEVLRNYRQWVELDTFWKIFRESIQSVKLPFTGEPLKGAQIMGFLETRTLDFEHLFVLGLNEGKIPAKSQNNTFIPFNLRRAFKMPTFLDQDAIYAYHFYRLIQRAQQIYLCYNTEIGDTGDGEKSRFVLQIEQELTKRNPHLCVNKKLIGAPMGGTIDVPLLEVRKTEAVMHQLSKFEVDLAEEESTVSEPRKRPLSPSALNTYIQCPIQFYMKYVAGLKAKDELQEELNAALFGNVLHTTIELLYKPFKGQLIEKSLIDKILKDTARIDKALNIAFKKEQFEHHKEGMNLLLKKVIRKLVDAILKYDKNTAPFEIIGLEDHQYVSNIKLNNGQEIALSGTIDRIDQIPREDGEWVVRVLDYKTGNVKVSSSGKKNQSIDDYLSKYFEDPSVKTGFQAYLYAWLYWKHSGMKKQLNIQAGLYNLKQFNANGIIYLRKGELLDYNFFTAFEDKLTALLNEIYNTDIPFSRAEDVIRYDYSELKELVGIVE